jgi:hypothetical protein
MKNLSHLINPQPIRSLYLVSFEEFSYDEYDSFIVVACTEEEAARLTPDERMNRHIGIKMGYYFPEVDPGHIKFYRDACGRGRSIRRIGDAWVDLEWGDVPIASFNAG